MKLGLLLVLATAAFVPHLSKGKIISRCELKQKLQQALSTTQANKRNHNQIIALVSCEVERRSHLDSSLIMGNAVLPPPAVTPTAQAVAGNDTVTAMGTSSTTPVVDVSTADAAYGIVLSVRRKREAPRSKGGEEDDDNSENDDKSENDNSEDEDNSEDDDNNEEDNSEDDDNNEEDNNEDEDNSEEDNSEDEENSDSSHDESDDDSSEDEENNEQSTETNVETAENDSQEMVNQGALTPTGTVVMDTTVMPNSTAGSSRRKRDAPSRKGHKKGGKKDKIKDEDSREENHAGKQSQESASSGENDEKVTDGGVRSTTSKPTTATSFTAAVSDRTSAGIRRIREARFRRSLDRREDKDEKDEEEEDKEEKGGKGGKHSHKPSEVGSHQQGSVKPTPSAASVPTKATAFVSATTKASATTSARASATTSARASATTSARASATASATAPSSTALILQRRRRASSMENKKDHDKSDKNKESNGSSSQEDHSYNPLNGSVNFYGLFQLSSSLCDSGNSGSKNECNTKCSAFVDDDITDDVECFVDSGYWRSILKEISSSCFKQMDTYFAGCQ